MKKSSLLSVVLVFLFSASTLANTGKPKANAGADTSGNIKATGSIVLSFKGRISNNANKLHWITEDEQGIKSFTIERSINNRGFYPIAIMPAMNEKGQLFYEYPDTDISRLTAQTFSYRLKITAADNNENYSQVITLSADKNGAVAIR
ncbi:MAG: hypothetical protein ABIQ88_01195 [Chitinophagaceae bacterium]